MNKAWLVILLASITTLMFKDPSLALSAMIKGANDSVQLAIELVALYGFWLGLFAILDKLGIADFIAKLLRPLIRFLFPGTDEKTQKYISMNMSANLLGLGNAATPMGINAIKGMDGGKEKVTTNMIMLVVISATSLQILPTTVIGMRATHGSVNPSDFLIPCIVATVLSTVIGVALVKIISNLGKLKAKKSKKKIENKLPLRIGTK